MEKSTFYKVISAILSIVLVATAAFFMFQVAKMNILPGKFFILASIILGLLIAILLLLQNLAAQRKVARFFSTLLLLLNCFVLIVGNLYINQTDQFIQKVTDNTGKNKSTVAMIVLKENEAEKVKDLDGMKIGSLKEIDKTGTKKMFSDLDKKGISYKKKKYTALTEQVQDLYDGKIDAMVLNEGYRHNIEEFDQFRDFSDKTKVVHNVTYFVEKNNTANAVSDVTQKPFTIFISGNDSYGTIDELTRSDVNMLVTVNPQTSTVLLTSIPRDFYVPLVCSDGACAQGALDKLTHTGMHGIDTTRETLEDLLGVDINYTFRVNFSSAEQIVDALGGVDITVEPGLEIESFGADGALGGLEAGTHHLEGKRALAFARERYSYEDGDVQRVKNQQQVLEAIVHKAISSDTLSNYSTLLKSMEGAFETNMSQEEISALIQYQLNENPKWKFENYVLNGQGETMFCAELGQGASVLVPDQRTIDIAKKKIDAVMDGKSSKTIKEDLDEAIEYPAYMEGVEPVEIPVEEVVEEPIVESQQPVVDYSQQYYDPNQYQVYTPQPETNSETPTTQQYVDPSLYQEPVQSY